MCDKGRKKPRCLRLEACVANSMPMMRNDCFPCLSLIRGQDAFPACKTIWYVFGEFCYGNV